MIPRPVPPAGQEILIDPEHLIASSLFGSGSGFVIVVILFVSSLKVFPESFCIKESDRIT